MKNIELANEIAEMMKSIKASQAVAEALKVESDFKPLNRSYTYRGNKF